MAKAPSKKSIQEQNVQYNHTHSLTNDFSVELLDNEKRTEWPGIPIEELFSYTFREPQFSPNSKWLSFTVNGFFYIRNIDPYSRTISFLRLLFLSLSSSFHFDLI
jgi:hypothetical protein